ncbi:hypothetical protein DFH07DRAFT_771920 [Mycena maculata]|uniref:Uncharacterized protein n=1 Tax=Mycena maculata TaxID=230809 RepID=A0AAD7NGP9_9AGAR|nr:hypothetical protein DFH07DRAFT_771920 [Mycena maculata]
MGAFLDEDLQKLLAAINDLPPSVLNGRRDGLLATHLTPGLSADPDPVPVFPIHKDGHYRAFNISWERAFFMQPGAPRETLYALVTRGKYGLLLVHTWASHYAKLIEDSGERECALHDFKVHTPTAGMIRNDGLPSSLQMPFAQVNLVTYVTCKSVCRPRLDHVLNILDTVFPDRDYQCYVKTLSSKL